MRSRRSVASVRMLPLYGGMGRSGRAVRLMEARPCVRFLLWSKEREKRSDTGEEILAGDAANGFRTRSYSGLGCCTFRSPQPTWPGNHRVDSANHFPHGLVSAYRVTRRRASERGIPLDQRAVYGHGSEMRGNC